MVNETILSSKNIETKLVHYLEPFRNFALSASIYHLFETGLYDLLIESGAITLDTISTKLSLDKLRLAGFLHYLKNEKYLSFVDGKYSLTHECVELSAFRAWYKMLIGGYGMAFLGVG